MRSTKYDWMALRRYATFGGYDPSTGNTNPIKLVIQTIWVKAFYRPDGTGNEFVMYTIDAATDFRIYNELNLGKLYVRELPEWPAIYDPYNPTKRYFPTNVWAWVDVARPTFDRESEKTRFNWVKIQGNFNATAGTRFNKHYEAKMASLKPDDVLSGDNLVAPPEGRPEDVTSFEQVEQRLHTVIQIGDGIVNKG